VLIARNIRMFTVLINVRNLNHKLQVLVPLPLHVSNWGLSSRRNPIRLRVIVLMDSYEDPNG